MPLQSCPTASWRHALHRCSSDTAACARQAGRTRKNISSIASMPSLFTISAPGCACSAPPLGTPSACWLPACRRTQKKSADKLDSRCQVRMQFSIYSI